MNPESAQPLATRLPEHWRVVDIGGGAAPFERADHVIDGLAYEERGRLCGGQRPARERFTRETWTQLDLCQRQPWPFPDGRFDYAVCTHVLEDLRDPIWVCAEMQRIARAGYIEVPSRVAEQSRGVEHPLYAGYYHHRWLVSIEDGVLVFRHKPHSLHALRDAVVVTLGPWRMINPRHAVLTLEWNGTLAAREQLEFDEATVNRELCRFAAQARQLPDLTVPRGGSGRERLLRWLYFQRLRRGYGAGL